MRISEQEARKILRRWDWQWHIALMALMWCFAFLIYDIYMDYPWFMAVQILITIANWANCLVAWRHRRVWKGFVNHVWGHK